MTNTSAVVQTLPEWVVWLSALGPVISGSVTAIVALAVGIIAYRQWLTARDKLLLDLFEKRFAVYLDVRRIVSEAVQLGKLDDPSLPNEVLARGRFLFGPDVVLALKELHRMCSGLIVNDVGAVRALEQHLDVFTGQMAQYMQMPYRHLTKQ